MNINTGLSGALTGAAVAGPWGALAGGLGGLLLGQEDPSGKYYEEMMNAAKGIKNPELQKYTPFDYQSVGQLNSELESAVTLGPSAMQGVATDPALYAAQMSALNRLMDISNAGGKDAQFMADQARAQNDVNTNLRGNTGAIQQNLATRGFSGGMSEMVARQMAAQSGANRQAQMELDANAAAQQRAMQALNNSAQLGGQMQAAQFGQKSAQAQAQDAVNQFNARNSQNVMSNNVGIKNNAQAANLQNQQNIANLNTGGKNTAQQYNLNLPQQNFENELRKRGLINQGATGMAQAASNQAQQQNQFLGNAMSATAQAFGKNKKDSKNDWSW